MFYEVWYITLETSVNLLTCVYLWQDYFRITHCVGMKINNSQQWCTILNTSAFFISKISCRRGKEDLKCAFTILLECEKPSILAKLLYGSEQTLLWNWFYWSHGWERSERSSFIKYYRFFFTLRNHIYQK